MVTRESAHLLAALLESPDFTDALRQLAEENTATEIEALRVQVRLGNTHRATIHEGRAAMMEELPAILRRAANKFNQPQK